MTVRDAVPALDAELRAEATRSDGRRSPGSGSALRLAEIAGSLRFSGILVRPGDLAALVTNGRVPAGRSLEACNAIADYAAAAAYVAALGRRRRQPLVRVEEIVALHAQATRRSSFDQPGKWRSATAAALRGGAVPPPAWLVSRDVRSARRALRTSPGAGPARLSVARRFSRAAFAHPPVRYGKRTRDPALSQPALNALGVPPVRYPSARRAALCSGARSSRRRRLVAERTFSRAFAAQVAARARRHISVAGRCARRTIHN
jgi:hypothetical protein